MLRSVLLFLSERRGIQGLTRRSGLARRVAHRFVAGETLDEAMAVCRRLGGQGMEVTLDRLGESVVSEAQAIQATEAYIELLERIDSESCLRASISIKLTQMGLAIDRDLCERNVRRLVEAAVAHNNFVRIDMESSEYTEATLSLFYDLWDEFKNVGVVIQSYLRRSESDVRRLASLGAPVRLCKGAYKEPADVAFQKKKDVDANYVRLLEILVASESPLAVATHDSRMIEAAKRLLGNGARRKAPFEFQMLYGVRRDLQAQLVREGYRMRVYVPYGTDWYPYFMRRMAERPANLLFVLRAVTGG
jgi:proline dehydrogenase